MNISKIFTFKKITEKGGASSKSGASNIELVNLGDNTSYGEHLLVDTKTDEYSFLRKIQYDFQYINSEHSNTLNVYKILDRDNSYIIAGKNKAQQIIYK